MRECRHKAWCRRRNEPLRLTSAPRPLLLASPLTRRIDRFDRIAQAYCASTPIGRRGFPDFYVNPAIASARSVATPGEFAVGSAANRRWYARIVLRSMPVTRSISRWPAPARSSVQIVVCKCGFKTFTPRFPSAMRGWKVTSCFLCPRPAMPPLGRLNQAGPEWGNLGGHKRGSLGGRRGRSAHDALGTARTRCWRHAWVLDLDIRGYFDNIDHDLLMRAVRKHTDCRWILLYIERWLKADVCMPDGELQKTVKGTPQGGVISPLLANLFLHYAFDCWMARCYPDVKFERYADDIICHCDSRQQAQALHSALADRLAACNLELHPDKTRIVYCADANRRGDYECRRFDFLGYTFKPRQAMNSRGQVFTSFSPAVSDKAGKTMRRTIRSWGLARLSRYSLQEIVDRFSSTLVGWIRYYGLFHPSELQQALRSLDFHLMRWAQRKYKRLRGHITRAWNWVAELRRRSPDLFPHWSVGMRTVWTIGAV